MNLRILKKLSKRAAPLLIALGERREQFAARAQDSYGVPLVRDRKHWDRSRCHPTYKGWNNWSVPAGREIVFTTRTGHTVVMRPPSCPLKGTVMFGGTDGGEQPEWSEDNAYSILIDYCFWHFGDVVGEELDWVSNRALNTPRQVFSAAADMVAERARKAVR